MFNIHLFLIDIWGKLGNININLIKSRNDYIDYG